jgi:tryptophan-rich sensory protein
LVLIGAATQVVMGYLPTALGLGEPIGVKSDRLKTPITPAGWAFAIWGVIFLGCLVAAVRQWTRAGRADASYNSALWPFAGLLVLNTAWEVYVPARDIDFGSVAIIAAELVLAMVAFLRVRAGHWLASATLGLFAGWLTAATAVNVAAALRHSGSGGFEVPILGLGVAAACGLSCFRPSAWYAAGFGWALVGILAETDSTAVKLVAGVGLACVVACYTLCRRAA